MELAGSKILVIGLGKTGLAVTQFLQRQGATPILTDEKPLSELNSAVSALGDIRHHLEFRAYDAAGIMDDVDLVIPSPGVPPFNPLLQRAVARGIPVLSEIELASRFLTEPIVAITGTNGKTTVTTLIGEILVHAGYSVFVGGNIGKPLIGCAGDTDRPYDFIVAEVSSFQLEWIESFHPHVAILLNTTCDHIDYHGSFAAYRTAKEKIFQNQTETDLAILNGDETESIGLSGKLRAETKLFSRLTRPSNGIRLEGEVLRHYAPAGPEETYPLDMIKIPGAHNIENVMAAILAARKCGCRPDRIIEAISHFEGVAHRIEFAGQRQGVRFYDDSKGTNVGAVLRAVESFSGPVILLLGGRDKGGDFESLAPLIRKNVKRVVIFGEARDRINELVGGVVETAVVSSLKDAFEVARQNAVAGDVVLLSPGCASFDEFANYAERGRVFQEMVRALPL